MPKFINLGNVKRCLDDKELANYSATGKQAQVNAED